MKLKTSGGFTLVELVVGIVVLAIAMVGMNTMLISQSKDALEPVYRLRASQLGQSIMQDILARAYDQNSDHNGGYYRCDEIWQTTGTLMGCTATTNYGPDTGETNLSDYNDVDDFFTITKESPTEPVFVAASTYVPNYNNYFVKIAVRADSTTMKRIDVTIKTPSDEEILFSALKGNY